MRIAVFATCVGDVMFPQAPAATVRLLERLGHEVVFPAAQGCCGQMHVNTGYFRQALPLVRNHVRVFEPVLDGEWDAVVVPSGSCTGSVRHQHAMVARSQGDEPLARRAQAVADRTFDLAELLVDVLGVVDVGAYFPHTVTYHPTCHSLRMIGVGDRPLRLLAAVGGIDLRELGAAEECCGFGGTFSLKNAETATAMVQDKVDQVLATGAEVLTAGDYSCLMNIAGRLSRQQSGVAVAHLAEVLAATREEPWAPTPSTAAHPTGARPRSPHGRPAVPTAPAAAPGGCGCAGGGCRGDER